MLRFLIFVSFLLIFWITCQIRSKIGKFAKKLNFLPYLAWNSKNKQKFKSPKSNSKLIFWIFVNFQPILTKKWQKTCFLWFSQKLWVLVKIWLTNVFLVKFPFWKVYLYALLWIRYEVMLQNKNAQTCCVAPLKIGKSFVIWDVQQIWSAVWYVHNSICKDFQ